MAGDVKDYAHFLPAEVSFQKRHYFPLGFGQVGVVGRQVREGFVARFAEGKKLALGYTVLVGVDFRLRA
jgi:hypothetical protein